MITTLPDREKASHDKAVKPYDNDLLLACHADLWRRQAWNMRDQDHRWILGRRAATTREILNRKLSPA